MVTTFHDLCLDVIIEIFSYFNIHEIFYSYCLLIPCLPKLLINGRVRSHVRSNNEYFIRWILPHIKLPQIISLNVPKRPYNPSIFRFTGLRSLVLHDVDDPLILLEKSNDWPPSSLEHLALSIRNPDIPNKPSNIGIRVLEKVFQLSCLKSFELHESKASLKMVELHDQLHFPAKFHSSNLQSLILTVYCHWNTLPSILHYAPNLRSFQFYSSINSSEKYLSQLSFLSLRKLQFRLRGLQIHILLELFRNTPCLRQLKLTCTVPIENQCCSNLLKSDTWIQLMDTYTVRLKILDVDIEFYLDNYSHKAIEMINEDFRKLNLKLDIDSENGYRTWKLSGIFKREINNQ